MMMGFIPGSVILYREPGFGVLWPSIYCTDDVAPKTFLRTRPLGYVTLVLKLAGIIDASNLRWAVSADLHQFDPFAADEGSKQATPGLHDAYIVALEALESGLELSHWKSVLSGHDDNAIVVDSEDELESDDEMRLVIERSKFDFHAQHTPVEPPAGSGSNAWLSNFINPQGQAEKLPSSAFGDQGALPLRRRWKSHSRLPAPTSSPSRKSESYSQCSQSLKRLIPSDTKYSDDEMVSPPRRRVTTSSRDSRRVGSFDYSSQSSNCTRSPTFLVSDGDDGLPPTSRQKKPQKSSAVIGRPPQDLEQNQRSPLKQDTSTSQTDLRNDLNVSAATATSGDVVEDLDESSQFVQIFVGPEVEGDSSVDPERKQHKFQLVKSHIWDRACFRDTVSARNYFTPVGDNTWELRHPRLAEIDSEDFALVAEFLSDGDFGHRNPEGQDQVGNTFAECISAWRTAELLSLDDLLDHIVGKVRATRPWWDMVSVMAFACSVYQSEVPLEAHVEMKAMLSEYIAESYDIYIEDDHLRGEFMARLRQLPDLKKHVLAAVLAQLDRRVQSHGEQAVRHEEEATDNDLDL